MKKMISFLLAGLLALSMTGCFQQTQKSKVPFYYPRAELDFGAPDGVISQEFHDVSGHSDDLRYLLALYLQGPSDSELVQSFPVDTILVELLQEDETVTVTLSSHPTRLDDMELNIACICLAETCFAICDAQLVHIQSLADPSGQSINTTITRDSILLPGYEILPEDTE